MEFLRETPDVVP
jgi:hypothetical protein